MKLYIDDIRECPEGWTLARNINEAIRAIAKFDFEEISIDHDISYTVTVANVSRPYPYNECFCAVAYFIGEKHWIHKKVDEKVGIMRPHLYPKITVHSANPVGADEIMAILKDYGLSSTFIQGKPCNRFEPASRSEERRINIQKNDSA